jgi:hypothetical protein
LSAIALALALVVLAPPHVDAEAAFAYGFGARSAFGVLASGTASWPLSETRAMRSGIEAGLIGGYQNEPYSLTAPLTLPSVVTGSNHRVELLAMGGPSLALLESRRLELALLAFAGWTHVSMRGSLRSDSQGFARSYAADASEFTFGLTVRLGVRLSPRVGLNARFLLPVPWAGLAVSSYFMASAGFTVRW